MVGLTKHYYQPRILWTRWSCSQKTKQEYYEKNQEDAIWSDNKIKALNHCM